MARGQMWHKKSFYVQYEVFLSERKVKSIEQYLIRTPVCDFLLLVPLSAVLWHFHTMVIFFK